MDALLRARLYQQLAGRNIVFNPVEPEPFDLVDLTKDVTNSTRIYHLRTECVREALEGATLIITDSQALSEAVQRVLPRAAVVTLPYGVSPGRVNPHERSEDKAIIGLINHDRATEMNNAYALKLLKALDRKLLIFGHPLPGIEGEVIAEKDFETFAAKCDILLLPSLPGALNSTTLPLALMEAGTVLLCHNAPGYYDLDAATGVQVLPNDPAAWSAILTILESQPAKLRAMQERNRAYAIRQNRESFGRLAALVDQFDSLPPRPSEGCGCAKKGNRVLAQSVSKETPPTQPVQDQPISEKEL